MYKIPIKKFEPTPDEKRQAIMDKAYYDKRTEFGVGYGGEPTYPKATPTTTKKPKLNALNKLKK
jgi:hypothetical protein